jgi:DNA modification methylase
VPEWIVHHGDCRDVLATLAPESIDSALMDPPYGLGFMGAEWDKFGGRGMKAETIAAQKAAEERNEPFGRSGKAAKPAPGEKAAFKAFMGEVASACLRVLKPGAHVLVFGGTRTYHWMADAWEDAGFEVRDMMSWLYGQGFPKNVNIAKAIDKAFGVQPVAVLPADLGMANNPDWNDLKTKKVMPPPTTPDAIKWRGFGTALKPALEPLMLARKPIDGPIYRNVMERGTGALNLDACAVGGDGTRQEPEAYTKVNPSGRWPANVVMDEAAGAILDAQAGVSKDGVAVKRNGRGGRFCHSQEDKLGAPVPDQGYGGSGGPSRFYYCPKPCKAEKEAGLAAFDPATAAELTGRKEGSAGLVMQHADGREKANPYAGTSGSQPRKNTHPTVKPIEVLRYFARLITPPGGTVLDPFSGSGSCGIAAGLEGFNYIGVELDPEGKGFPDIARARIEHHVGPSEGPRPKLRPRRRPGFQSAMFKGFM